MHSVASLANTSGKRLLEDLATLYNMCMNNMVQMFRGIKIKILVGIYFVVYLLFDAINNVNN